MCMQARATALLASAGGHGDRNRIGHGSAAAGCTQTCRLILTVGHWCGTSDVADLLLPQPSARVDRPLSMLGATTYASRASPGMASTSRIMVRSAFSTVMPTKCAMPASVCCTVPLFLSMRPDHRTTTLCAGNFLGDMSKGSDSITKDVRTNIWRIKALGFNAIRLAFTFDILTRPTGTFPQSCAVASKQAVINSVLHPGLKSKVPNSQPPNIPGVLAKLIQI